MNMGEGTICSFLPTKEHAGLYQRAFENQKLSHQKVYFDLDIYKFLQHKLANSAWQIDHGEIHIDWTREAAPFPSVVATAH